jgi:hypothetical protein
MLKRANTPTRSDPICYRSVDNLVDTDFYYYDKDGFELNQAEQKYYAAMGHPIDYPCLNHVCWQEPWYYLEPNSLLLLDHSLVLHRCRYEGDAAKQLHDISKSMPYAHLLLQTKPKWGLDFALDAVYGDHVYEVLHVEYDSRDYDQFCNQKIILEYTFNHMDWNDAASQIWQHRNEWQHLKGYDQNHWKAKYLLGWDYAELLEKAV